MVSSNFIQCPRCGKLHNNSQQSKLCTDCTQIVNESLSNDQSLFESKQFNDDGFFDGKKI